MDLKDDSKDVLASRGFNVQTGSFGTPYRVEKRDSVEPVIPNHQLPQAFEHEIVVVDLVSGDPIERPSEGKVVSEGTNDWWESCSQGIIDPRPRAMASVSKQLDRIVEHGGIFVVFTAMRWKYSFRFGCVVNDPYEGRHVRGQDLPYDNWNFLSMLSKDHVEVSRDTGEEISPVCSGPFSDLMSKYDDKSYFSCTLSKGYQLNDENWVTLAKGKYDAPVSAAIPVLNGEGKKPGWIFLLHQIGNKAGFLTELIGDILPGMTPHLFPYAEEAKWLTSTTYELPEIIALQDKIEAIKKDVALQVQKVEMAIVTIREEKKYLYDLLTETDDALVQAVIEGLRVLGFEDVVDVDQVIKDGGEEASLREDIQIKDSSPILIVDVKGITGRPADPEAMQPYKHATIRMKEWKTTEVNALAIINHQRHLPPLDRDNDMPFRQEILDGASQIDLGLMTTWDLYRLVRSSLRNKWKPEHVKPLFYRRGRIEIVPTHYRYIGSIEQVWPKAQAISIKITDRGLKKGDRIAFEMHIEFWEQAVESLRLDDQDVQEAPAGVEVGIKTEWANCLRKGICVYVIDGSPVS